MPIIGTSPESIDLAEDRKRFGKLIEELGIPQPPGAIATSVEEALAGAHKVEYPVLVRPSYVLGGRAMVIAYDDQDVIRYMSTAIEYSQERPVLIDRFLENAQEVDVDALCDGRDVVIAGIMQHIEEAGVHSVTPPVCSRRWILRPRCLTPACPHAQASACARRCGPREPAVCRAAGQGVRHRSQPARFTHCAVRVEGHGVQLAKVASRLMTAAHSASFYPSRSKAAAIWIRATTSS